jgi:hypothetical protein
VTGCEYPSLRSLVNRAIDVGCGERGWDRKTGSAIRRARPTTRYETGPSRRQGMRHPCHQEVVSVPAPVSRIGTTVEVAATTPATRPTEGRTKEEAATTASSRHRGPTVDRRYLFASLATNWPKFLRVPREEDPDSGSRAWLRRQARLTQEPLAPTSLRSVLHKNPFR